MNSIQHTLNKLSQNTTVLAKRVDQVIVFSNKFPRSLCDS